MIIKAIVLIFLAVASSEGRPDSDIGKFPEGSHSKNDFDKNDSSDEELGPNKENGPTPPPPPPPTMPPTEPPVRPKPPIRPPPPPPPRPQPPPSVPRPPVPRPAPPPPEPPPVAPSGSAPELPIVYILDDVIKVPFPALTNSIIHQFGAWTPDSFDLEQVRPRQVAALPYESWAVSQLSTAPKEGGENVPDEGTQMKARLGFWPWERPQRIPPSWLRG